MRRPILIPCCIEAPLGAMVLCNVPEKALLVHDARQFMHARSVGDMPRHPILPSL